MALAANALVYAPDVGGAVLGTMSGTGGGPIYLRRSPSLAVKIALCKVELGHRRASE